MVILLSMIKNNLILPIVFVAIVSTLSVPIMSAYAGGSLFSGVYDVSNWDTELNGGDGNVLAENTSDVLITGDDSDQGQTDTSFSLVMPCDGNVDFDWDYRTVDDDGPEFDPAGYSVDGVFTQISDDDGDDVQNGMETVPVLAGQIFGFVVRTNDGDEGEASASFTPTEFPPEECGPALLMVQLDVKPQSCPNPINTKSQGVLPVAILGTASFDVTQIDVSSITLEGISPLRDAIEDVATPLQVPTVPEPDSCTDEGPDGFDDLTLKFDTQEVLGALGFPSKGDMTSVELEGTLLDGTLFEGYDIIIIK